MKYGQTFDHHCFKLDHADQVWLCWQVFDWYDQVGDGYLKHTQLGDNLHAAQMLQEEHVRFEMQARVSRSSFVVRHGVSVLCA